jgi:hypothetical protein
MAFTWQHPGHAPSCQHAAVDFKPKSPAISAHPVPHEGRIAIVTDVGAGCGGREFRQKTNVVARGRRSRVVLTPRRWCQVGERDFTCDGGKKARSPGRARNKLLKPSRREGRADPGEPVVTHSCAFYTLHARLRVQRAPGFPCALCLFEGQKILHSSGTSCRGKSNVHPSSPRERNCAHRWRCEPCGAFAPLGERRRMIDPGAAHPSRRAQAAAHLRMTALLNGLAV